MQWAIEFTWFCVVLCLNWATNLREMWRSIFLECGLLPSSWPCLFLFLLALISPPFPCSLVLNPSCTDSSDTPRLYPRSAVPGRGRSLDPFPIRFYKLHQCKRSTPLCNLRVGIHRLITTTLRSRCEISLRAGRVTVLRKTIHFSQIRMILLSAPLKFHKIKHESSIFGTDPNILAVLSDKWGPIFFLDCSTCLPCLWNHHVIHKTDWRCMVKGHRLIHISGGAEGVFKSRWESSRTWQINAQWWKFL